MMNSISAQSFHRAFGQVIRRYRHAQGLTQEGLADRAGLHRTYVSQIERGLKSASLATLLCLSSALQVPPDRLVREALELSEENVKGARH